MTFSKILTLILLIIGFIPVVLLTIVGWVIAYPIIALANLYVALCRYFQSGRWHYEWPHDNF